MVRDRWALLVALLAASACTTFAAPRPARVREGHHRSVTLAASTPTGDQAGWFWHLDCASSCSHSVAALDLNFSRGFRHGDGSGYEVGGGLNGTQPYVEGYRQLRGDTVGAFGVGLRLGLALGSWSEHRLEARYERTLSPGTDLLFAPALMLHVGNSPNGANPGGVFAFTPAIGLELGEGRPHLTPAVAWVVGRGWRSSYGQDLGSFNVSFLAVSLGVAF